MSTIRQLSGFDQYKVGWQEQTISAAGAFVAILVIALVSRDVLDYTGSAAVVGSMGASAVLLFSAPHNALAQPWPASAGQLVPALIGVSCAKVIANVPLSAACAVGLSVAAMHLGHFIHPPGGATALVAVIGGSGVRDLGYSFVWRPVMVNTVCILIVAVAFNALFRRRRYPASLGRRRRTPAQPRLVSRDAVVAALCELESCVDVSEADLIGLYRSLPPADPTPPR